jgi:hypothetical protein
MRVRDERSSSFHRRLLPWALSAGLTACAASGNHGTFAADSGGPSPEAGFAQSDGGPCGTSAIVEGCPCSLVAETAPCWTGPANERGVGACHDGTSVCQAAGESQAWGPCSGEELVCTGGADTGAPDTSAPDTSAPADSQAATTDSPVDVPPDVSFPTDGGPCNGVVVSPEPGLGAWYKLDETTGPVCDSSGNNNDGVMEGAGFVRGVPGKIGNAIQFTGTDGRVHVPAAPSLDFTTGATIELWLQVATTSSAVGSPVSRGTGNEDANVLMDASCGNLQTIFTNAQQTTNVTSACNVITAAVWTHIGVVNDGTTLTLYVNGAVQTTAAGGDMGPLSSDLYMGEREQGIFALAGALDDVKWWTVARTQAEVCGDAGGTWTGSACQL